jgi:hypothetical protein
VCAVVLCTCPFRWPREGNQSVTSLVICRPMEIRRMSNYSFKKIHHFTTSVACDAILLTPKWRPSSSNIEINRVMMAWYTLLSTVDSKMGPTRRPRDNAHHTVFFMVVRSFHVTLVYLHLARSCTSDWLCIHQGGTTRRH